jgi:hypothetical protein
MPYPATHINRHCSAPSYTSVKESGGFLFYFIYLLIFTYIYLYFVIVILTCPLGPGPL